MQDTIGIIIDITTTFSTSTEYNTVTVIVVNSCYGKICKYAKNYKKISIRSLLLRNFIPQRMNIFLKSVFLVIDNKHTERTLNSAS